MPATWPWSVNWSNTSERRPVSVTTLGSLGAASRCGYCRCGLGSDCLHGVWSCLWSATERARSGMMITPPSRPDDMAAGGEHPQGRPRPVRLRSSDCAETIRRPRVYATVTEWPTTALKFLRMLLYRGSRDCTRPTSSVARDMRVYLPFLCASQRYDQRTHMNRSRGCSM